MNPAASSHCQPKGVWEDRAAHVTANQGNRQQAGSGTPAGPPPGYGLAGSFDRGMRNRRDPTRPPASGKDCAYKAGGLKSSTAGRESEGSVVPVKAAKNRWREAALLGSSWAEGKCEGMVDRPNNPIDKVQELQRRLYVCAKQSKTRRFHALYDRIYRGDVLWEACVNPRPDPSTRFHLKGGHLARSGVVRAS